MRSYGRPKLVIIVLRFHLLHRQRNQGGSGVGQVLGPIAAPSGCGRREIKHGHRAVRRRGPEPCAAAAHIRSQRPVRLCRCRCRCLAKQPQPRPETVGQLPVCAQLLAKTAASKAYRRTERTLRQEYKFGISTAWAAPYTIQSLACIEGIGFRGLQLVKSRPWSRGCLRGCTAVAVNAYFCVVANYANEPIALFPPLARIRFSNRNSFDAHLHFLANFH